MKNPFRRNLHLSKNSDLDTIKLTKLNESYLGVDCSDIGIYYELNDYFAFRPDGYKFMPAFKSKRWDGFVRLFSMYNKSIPQGLFSNILKFAKNRQYKIEVDNSVKDSYVIDINDSEIYNFLENITVKINDKDITPYQYQLDAVLTCLKSPKSLIVSPTSSGKTLQIGLLLRYLESILENKILIIVPNVSLINQTHNDLIDYFNHNWNVDEHTHKIQAGTAKQSDKKIFISTYQSLIKITKSNECLDYFSQFDAIIVDEVHQAKAVTISNIVHSCVNAKYKLGFTGTLGTSKADNLSIQGLFGKSTEIITTKELMNDGKIANLKIKCIQLKYPDGICKSNTKMKYPDEIDFIATNKQRSQFISTFSSMFKNNSLILVTRIEHGEMIRDFLMNDSKNVNKNIHLITGSTKGLVREEIRQETENNNDTILISTYSLFSTGISIKNLHYIVFASPTKSKIRVLQSVGRGLRINKTKSSVVIYDLIDDFSWKSHKNYSVKHFFDRVEHYDSQQFDYSISKVELSKV